MTAGRNPASVRSMLGSNTARIGFALAALLLCGRLPAQPDIAPADPARSYHGYGFSISAPPGNKWLIAPAQAGHKVEFYRRPSRKEARRQHSLIAAVATFWTADCDAAADCLDAILAELRKDVPDSRFTRTDVEVVSSPAPTPGCIRVRSLQHDRGVPGQEGKTYELHSDGMLCSHPDAPNLILNPMYSERLRQGNRRHEIAPEDVETFLQAFRFDVIGSLVVDSAQSFGEPLGSMTWDGTRLWVEHANKLSHIDTAENRVVRSIDIPGPGMALLFANQSLWMGDYENRRLLRLDPETGQELARLPMPGSPADIASLDGDVWITHDNHGQVVRVSMSTNSIVGAVDIGSSNAGIVAAFGAIWVSNMNDDSVYRIDPASNSVIGRTYVCSDPLDLVVSGDYVWVGCFESGTVARLDSKSGRVLERYETGGTPFMLDAGDHQLWIANSQLGTVSRFNIDRGKVDANISVGANPIFVRIADGSVWVTERSGGTLYRIVDRAARAQ